MIKIIQLIFKCDLFWVLCVFMGFSKYGILKTRLVSFLGIRGSYLIAIARARLKHRIPIQVLIRIYLWGGADKSLAQTTSQCHRTESIVLLERGVCSCAELQVLSCCRGWKEACQLTRAISTTLRRELSSSFFSCKERHWRKFIPFWQKEHAPSYATVKNWVAQIKHGGFFTCDVSRTGRPKTVTIPEIIDQIHELILEESQISAKSIAEQLGISHERVGSIIHEDLDMQKLSAKWVPKCLNTDQKCQRCQSSEQFWNFFGAIQMISCRDWWPWMKPGYITMTRRQSNNQWSGSIAAHPAPKNSECKNLLEKILASIFWGQGGIPLIDYLLKGQTINVEYYSSLLVKLKDILKEKCFGKVTKGFLFLHNNATAHWALATQKKLAYLGFQCLDHPPYSPDLALLEYHLFPGLKKQMKGRHFSSDVEVIAAADIWLDGQPSEFFLSGLQKLEQRAKKCIELHGEYVE